MKILFNTGHIYLHGGIEKSIADRTNYLVGNGYEIYVLTTEQKALPPCYALDDRIELIDLGINYNRQQSYFSIKNLKKGIRHYQRQKKILRQIKPDVILSPNYNFDHFWLPFIKGKAKLIKERHNSFYKKNEGEKSFFRKIKAKIDDWIDSKYDYIVVLNEEEKQYVTSDNAVVIPNLIRKTEDRAELTAKKVMAAGRIAPVKRFDELIEIWAKIREAHPDWELHIYGQDYLNTTEKLNSLIQQLNLEQQVFIRSAVPDLRMEMLNYSIFAMTSETECFPTVLLEALSVGLPIISFDCPNGPRHILTDQTDGFLIEHHNQADFAKALQYLMKNENQRKKMGKTARQNSQVFEINNIMKEWKKLFQDQGFKNL